jgi:hypothetical protein
VVIDQLMELAGNAPMPQVRALATYALQRRAAALTQVTAASDVATRASMALMAGDIRRFLSRPATPAGRAASAAIPPGAPIGEPAMEWLQMVQPPCSWENRYWQ